MAKKAKKTKSKTDRISNIILGLAIVIFLAAAVLLVVKLVSNHTQSGGDSNVSTDISYEQVDATDLAKALVKSESRAQKKYGEAYVELTGVISEADSTNNNYFILSCGSDDADLAEVAIICYFDPAEESLTENTYEVGDTVTVDGQVVYVSADVGYNLTIESITQ